MNEHEGHRAGGSAGTAPRASRGTPTPGGGGSPGGRSPRCHPPASRRAFTSDRALRLFRDDVEKLDLEHERGTGLDLATRAAVAVGEGGRAHQLALAADLHQL